MKNSSDDAIKQANLKRREALLKKIQNLDDYDLLIRLEIFLDENF